MPHPFWIAGPSLLLLIGLPWVGWALRQDVGRWRWPSSAPSLAKAAGQERTDA